MKKTAARRKQETMSLADVAETAHAFARAAGVLRGRIDGARGQRLLLAIRAGLMTPLRERGSLRNGEPAIDGGLHCVRLADTQLRDIFCAPESRIEGCTVVFPTDADEREARERALGWLERAPEELAGHLVAGIELLAWVVEGLALEIDAADTANARRAA
jgi:hypothetical protein